MNTKELLQKPAMAGSSKTSAAGGVLSALALCALTACGGGGGGTTAATPGPVAVASNDCSEDGNVMWTAGNTAQIDANVYGGDGSTILSTLQRKISTAGGASFRGETGLHLVNQVNTKTYAYVASNGMFAGSKVVTTENSYSKVVGNERQTYGLTVSTVREITTVASSYFTPYASTGAPLSPVLETAYRSNYSTTTEFNGATQAPLAQTSITTYSTEPVTVLAGTFAACKVKVEVSGGATVSNVSYAWFVGSGRYKGLILRTANADGVKTSEATRLLVNGQ